MRCVARAIGATVDDSACPPTTIQPLNMDRVVELAEIHRVTALAWDGLKLMPPAALSTVNAERMQRASIMGWARSTLLAKELARISEALTSAGVDFVAIKGPALSAQLYGDAAKRSMRDLDILVRTSDTAKAAALLADSGFEAVDPLAALDPMYRDLYGRYLVHWTYRHRRLGYFLELHVRLFDVPELFPVSVDEMIAKSANVDIDGIDVPTLSPKHHFYYLAVHGARHGWHRLQWITDFAAFAHRHAECTADEEFWDAVERYGLERIMTAGFVLSHRYFDIPIPSAVSARVKGGYVDKIVAYADRRLVCAAVPASVGEKCAEVAHTLRLRRGLRYRRSVLAAHLVAGQPDIVRFPLPRNLFFLYPALRPVMWALRTLEQSTGRCR